MEYILKAHFAKEFWFPGNVFSQRRKQQSNCKDSINSRTKYTIQMLMAHFGFIKLSFDYAIVFCSIAIGIGDAIGTGLSWDCDLAMPCQMQLASEGVESWRLFVST